MISQSQTTVLASDVEFTEHSSKEANNTGNIKLGESPNSY